MLKSVTAPYKHFMRLEKKSGRLFLTPKSDLLIIYTCHKSFFKFILEKYMPPRGAIPGWHNFIILASAESLISDYLLETFWTVGYFGFPSENTEKSAKLA